MNLFHSLALSLLETHLNKRNHLGEHQCCRRTLDNTKDDQRESIGGKAAAARKQGEASHAQDEHPFASVEITHAATSDQQDGKRKSIASDHQLELSEAGMQGALDRGDGDIDNKSIKHNDQRRTQYDDQHQPASPIRLVNHFLHFQRMPPWSHESNKLSMVFFHDTMKTRGDHETIGQYLLCTKSQEAHGTSSCKELRTAMVCSGNTSMRVLRNCPSLISNTPCFMAWFGEGESNHNHVAHLISEKRAPRRQMQGTTQGPGRTTSRK